MAPRGAVGFRPVESNALPSKHDPTGLFLRSAMQGNAHVESAVSKVNSLWAVDKNAVAE